MKAYLDSSVILRKLLGEPGAFSPWADWETAHSSEIARIESLRTLDRLRLQGDLDDAEVAEKRELLQAILENIGVVTINKTVLDRAALSFPTVIGTLDAIHLASALVYCEQRKETLTFLTHDRQLAIAARAVGLETLGIAQ